MTLDEFLKALLGATQLTLFFDIESTEDGAQVNFSGPDAPYLLARNAELMKAVEYLCNRLYERQGIRVALDCNDYRSIRAEELRLMAVTAAERVKKQGIPFKLNPMSPEERRIVHLSVKDDEAIRTESEGFGENRKVVIYPKSDGGPH